MNCGIDGSCKGELILLAPADVFSFNVVIDLKLGHMRRCSYQISGTII